MCFSAIAAVGSAAMGASSSRRAAKAQERAAERDIAFQRETRDLIFDRLDPFYQPGIMAQNVLAYEFGLGDRPMVGGTAPQIEAFTETLSMGQPAAPMTRQDVTAKTQEALRLANGNAREFQRLMYNTGPNATATAPQAAPQTVQRYRVGNNTFNTMEEAQAFANANRTGGTPYGGFTATPGYQFRMDQGTAAVNALAGARGGLDSGRTRQDLLTFGQGLAAQDYDNYLNRITNMAGQGFSAAGATANAATNAAAGTSNALAGIGNAQSAGAIAAGNAWQNAFSNLAGLNQYQRGTTGQGGGTGAYGLPRPF